MIRMVVAQLDFGQTVLAGALNALFTAVLVTAAAGLLVKWFEGRAAERRLEAEAREAERRRELEGLHAERMQERALEHQTRAELRRSYAELLVKQRRSREASRRLATAEQPRTQALAEAEAAYADFIDAYHGLNLDASRVMSRDARVLQKTLSDLYSVAEQGRSGAVQQLADNAKAARQNLEGSFRVRLGYETLHGRKTLTDYHDPNPDEPV